jgi:hypothetical protein
MADTDNYPAVMDEEDEKKRRDQQYPAPNPVPQSVTPADLQSVAIQNPPVPQSVSPADLQSIAVQHPPSAGSAPPAPIPPVMTAPSPATKPSYPAPQQPTWSQYAPPEKHGLAKAGSVLAQLNPLSDEIVNARPLRTAERNYGAAAKEYETQAAQRKAEQETASKTELEAAQAKEAEQRGAATEAGMQDVTVTLPSGQTARVPAKDAERLFGNIVTGASREAVGEGKNKTTEDVATGKNKTAEDIAKERVASAESIAKGHDLVSTENERIRASAANDPNKLTSMMKTQKQQAQATLPQIDKALDETEGIASELGPAEGRWNSFWQGTVGVKNPAFTHYKDEIGMVQTAVTLAHARGRMSNQLFDHFVQMFDAGKQAPENMIQALNVAKEWLTTYANMGEPGSPIGGGTAETPKATGGGKLPQGAVAGTLGGKHGYVLNGEFHGD